MAEETAWAFLGFVTGAVTGALLGVFFGGFKATDANGNGGLLKLGSLDKYDPNWPANGDLGARMNFLDNAGSTGQDAVDWAQNGTPAIPNGATEFIFTDATGPQSFTSIFTGSSNDALLSIPMGWVPSVFVPYGGVAGLEDFSMTHARLGSSQRSERFSALLLYQSDSAR